MTRKRHTEEQIIAVLKDAQAGVSVQELCRKHGISDATFYKWRTKYAGLEVSDVKKLRQLEEENRRLKQMVAEQALDIQALKAITAKTGKAQGETDSRHVSGGTLWAESATGVSISGAGSEHVTVLQPPTGRQRTSDENSRDCGNQATVRVPPDLCAVATGRVDGESQEDRADLSGGRALVAPSGAEEVRCPSARRPADAHPAETLVCDGLCA
jgi:putative transposase